MSKYELVVILSPEVAEDQVDPAVERVSHSISSKGGSIAGVERWGRRRLAYPIKRFTEGNYIITRFELAPQTVAELESQLELNEEVIRHLLVKVEGAWPQKAAETVAEVKPPEVPVLSEETGAKPEVA